MGTSLTYRFNSYKILDQDEAVLRANDNPFAVCICRREGDSSVYRNNLVIYCSKSNILNIFTFTGIKPQSMDFQEIQKTFMSMNFERLDKLFSEQKFDDFEQVLYRLAYDSDTGHENIFVYTYMLQLLGRGMDSRIHISISRLMGMILNHINGGESIGLYHALKAYELEPDNADILEIILYYNHIPEKVLSDEEAIKFSKKLLKIRPESLIVRSNTE